MSRRWIEEPQADPSIEAAKELLAGHDSAPRPGAQQRVWRRLQSPAPSSRRLGLWLAAAAAAGAAIVGSIALLDRPTYPSPQLVAVGGQVWTAAGDAPLEILNRPPIIETARRRLRTGPDGSARVEAWGAVALQIPPATELSLRATKDLLAVELNEGQIQAAATAPARIEIVAGAWRAILSPGARAEVARIAPDQIQIEARAGTVVVEGPEAPGRLQVGQRFEGGARRAAREPIAAPEPVAEAAVEPGPAAVEPAPAAVEPAAPSPRRSRRPRATRAPRPAATIAEAPVQRRAEPPPIAAPIEPAPAAAEPAAGRSPNAPNPPAVVAEAPIAPPPPRSETPPIPAAPAPPPPPSEESQYLAASKERDPQRALAAFDEIARRGGPMSELATHQAARLLMRLGRYQEALERWTAALERFPGGALDQEARLNLIECAIRKNQLDRARQEVDRFLARHAGSERLPELRFLRAEIARNQGRCADALVDYQAAARGSRSPSDALYFEAWCRLEIGDREGARAALGRYLDKFPHGRHAADARRALE